MEIARRGASASVRDIAGAAGYTQGALYAHFQSKELLLLELLRIHMARELSALEDLLRTADTYEGGVQEAVNNWLKALNSDQDWSMLSMELRMAALRDRDFASQYEALFDRHREAMAKLVERLFAEVGKTPPAPPLEIAGLLIALAHGLTLLRPATSQGAPDPSGRLMELVLRGLMCLAPSL